MTIDSFIVLVGRATHEKDWGRLRASMLALAVMGGLQAGGCALNRPGAGWTGDASGAGQIDGSVKEVVYANSGLSRRR